MDAQIKVGRSEVTYDRVSYIKYDFPNRADDVKKKLEMALTLRVLEKFQGSQCQALDIGCATGRYPIELARRGFLATGYDISTESLRICKRRARKSPYSHRLSFELRNILLEGCGGTFDIITSMMGTFNHVNHDQQDGFVNTCYRALNQNGMLALSLWNPESAYLSYLSFYTKEQKNAIAQNLVDEFSIKATLERAGFSDVKVMHFSFLPDECYDAWSSDLDDAQLINLDSSVSAFVPQKYSQMFIVLGFRNN